MGGFFSIMEQFDALLAQTIDSTLGLRCTLFGYQYSEILRSLMCAYLCGGSCIEDVTNHLMEHLSLHLTVQHVIPQKGTVMEVDNRVLVGVVRPSHRRGYEKSFLNQSATLYYTGAKFPSTIALQDLHYFVPYIKGKGIRDVYEIVRMRTITGKEAKQDEGADATDDLRLAFELRFSRQLYKEYRMIDVLQMTDLTFLDTTFSDIDGYITSRM